MTIHADLSKPNHELLAMIAKLHAENAQLKANQPKPRSISYKVSEKGAISIYGMGRFPITLYVGQYDRLAADWDNLKAFVEANRPKLSVKA